MTRARPETTRRGAALRLAVGLGLAGFYLATAPQNHATALDSYGFAYWIAELPVSAVPELRLFLWIAAMQVIHAALSLVMDTPDPFAVMAVLGAVQTAGAVILMERLLALRLGLPQAAAWITALGFALSYGVWRYAAETEIYASVALISLALLHAAFSFGPDGARRPSGRLIALAACGGLATLAYQPLGILAAVVIPAFLLTRLPLTWLLGYFATSGLVVGVGLALANVMSGSAADGVTVQSILDTDGKPLVIPGAAEFAQAMVAFAQNLLSLNWAFAFGPTRAIFEEFAGSGYAVFLYPAQFAQLAYLVFLVTLPLAVLLTGAALVLIRWSRTALGAMEGVILLWLAGQAAMVLLIDPVGFEPWIPAMAAVFLLLGVRLVGPLVARGHGAIAMGLVAVMAVHNWFAGVAIFAPPDHDFRRHQTAAVLDRAGTGDLMVVGRDWALHRFLGHATGGSAIQLTAIDDETAQARIRATLEDGGAVFLFPDVLAGDGDRPELDPDYAQGLDGIARLDVAERIPLGGGGHALRLAPGGD